MHDGGTMITGGTIRWAAVLLALAGGAAVGACSTSDTDKDDNYGTEIDACRECQGILVECTSTSQNEAQFVECRDQWLGCQRGRGIGPDDCRNPRDEVACDLCRDRLAECKDEGIAAECEAQFSVCKAFLMTRGDVAEQCSENGGVSPEAACSVCKKDHAKCLSDSSGVNTPAMCDTKLADCAAANQLAPGQCVAATGTAGCELCGEVRDGCLAAGGTECLPGYDSCTAALAPGLDCENSGTGGGGSGGAPPNSCTHDVCQSGPALEDGCNQCVTEVCDQDGYCCNTTAGQWDSFCLDIAETLPSCGCQGSTDTCAHSACEYGEALVDGCNDCVSQVCAQDSWCCTNKWDTYCVDAASAVPACGCAL